jgi:outer membrane protein TolC
MKKSLFFIILLCATSVIAQDLSLKTAVNEALQYSPVIQQSKANLDNAEWKRIESYSGFLPNLSGDVNYLLAKQYALTDVDINGSVASVPQIIPTSQFMLTGTLPLFDGLNNVYKYQSGRHLYQAAQADYDWNEFTVEMQTTLLFYRSLVAKNLMDVADQNVQTINDHYNDIKALLKVGIATKFDVLRVEVQMNEAAAEVLRTHDEYDFAKIRLIKTMGKDNDNRIPVGAFPSLQPSIVEGSNTVPNRKDLLALSEQEESLYKTQKANNRFWVPRLSAYGQLQAYNNINDSFSDWDSYREAYQLGLNLHWNIFDGASSLSKARQARAQAETAQYGIRAASLKASEDVEIWKRKFLYYCKLVDVKTTQTQKAEEAVRLAKESVRAGTKTNTDLLDAELDLFKSRSDVLNVRMGMVEALINFQLATGQKIYDFMG